MVLAHIVNQGNRTKDIRITEDVTFDTMLLTEKTLCGLKSSGFYKPSPIQLHGVPLGKCGFDLLLEAKSGTGKTAVFSVIALEKLDLTKSLQAVILAPTREIAAQICDVIKQIGSHFNGLKVEVVMGGLSVQEDVQKFQNKVHIVVGSPGRLRHLIQDKHIDISSVRLLILDEADKLMEKCFQRDINYIFSVLPKQKQVIMSSATYPECSKLFINKYVQNAQHICPDSNMILLGVAQHVTLVKNNSYIVRQTQHRYEELLKIISQMQFKQCLIFCNYQARVGELYKMLTRNKWPAEQLHGQQEQSERLDALRTLQEYKCRILIATDLAARGIDASNVDLVINFEPPFEWQTYLHRIGRAGRFGSFGTAITILSEGKEQNKFQAMLSSIKFPLNLKRMWTAEMFYDESSIEDNGIIEKSIATPYTESMNKTSNNQLWHALIGENYKITEVLQSFEEFQTSFDNISCDRNCEINTFSSLISSFNNNQVNLKGQGNEYKYFNSLSETVDNNLAYVHSLKSNICQGNQETSSKSYNENFRCHDLDGLEDEHTINFRRKTIRSCKEYKSSDKVHSKTFISENMSNTSHNSGKKSSNENINVIEDVHQPIDETKTDKIATDLILDYPTAFCSTKDKRATVKQHNTVYKRDNTSKHGRFNKLESKNIHPKTETRLIDIKRNKNVVYDQDIYPKRIPNKMNDKSNSQESISPNIRIIEIERNKFSLRNNYITWYNQFKAHMSQIESVFYFNEISQQYQ